MTINIRFPKSRKIRGAIVSLFAVCIAFALMGSSCSSSKTSKATTQLQNTSQNIKNQAETQLHNAEAYPVSQMQDSAELANLKERLLRTNSKDKIGYLYVLNNLGTPIGYYVTKGKVSSTGSQMLNEEQIDNCDDAHGNTGSAQCTISAMGDDGSYGPEEGGDRGIFFFTPSDVMIETDSDFIWSDAPLNVQVPLLVAATAAPTSKTR